jgi:hypothetical protein
MLKFTHYTTLQAVEMDSGAMMYIPSFIKIGLGIQKLWGGSPKHSFLCWPDTDPK